MSATDALDAAAIRAALPAAIADAIGALDCVATIDSTSSELLRRGAAQASCAVLIADAQQAGRGRRGRAWQSPPGANLYLSLWRRCDAAPRELAALGLAVGVALAEALRALGATAVQLKWPNDLVADGAKLGGVLVEAGSGGYVVGVGINCRLPRDVAATLDQPATDLATLGVGGSRNALAAALLATLLPALERYHALGLPAFHARWQALDALRGADVRVVAGDATLHGRALGLAADGGLRVALASGERVFHSADVSVRAA